MTMIGVAAQVALSCQRRRRAGLTRYHGSDMRRPRWRPSKRSASRAGAWGAGPRCQATPEEHRRLGISQKERPTEAGQKFTKGKSRGVGSMLTLARPINNTVMGNGSNPIIRAPRHLDPVAGHHCLCVRRPFENAAIGFDMGFILCAAAFD